MDFFWGDGGGVVTKLDYIYGSFLCILGSFLKVMIQNGDIFGGLLKFHFLFFWGGGGVGCLKFLIYFWGEW